jgi:hypothetical protein
METRILDPYPWPEDEICLWLGRTAYYAQRFEREFKLFCLRQKLPEEFPLIVRRQFRAKNIFLERLLVPLKRFYVPLEVFPTTKLSRSE